MDKIIFFAALAIFPFGQLLKVGYLNLFDILVVLLSFLTFIKKPSLPSWYKYFLYFVLFCIFTLVFNYQLFETKSLLYLVRLFSYSAVAIYIFNFVGAKDKMYKQLLGGKEVENKLIFLSVVSSIFGWIQYLIWPNLTSLKYLGWDDHLLRMVGTFLDPTYLALIIVLGIILSFKNDRVKTVIFLTLTLAFTYSRVSYLLFLLILIFIKYNSKTKLYLALFFGSILLLLPKNIGEGTTLTRTVSGNNKIINYSETIKIIKKSPVLGVGYNNICLARQKYLNDINSNSHSCNGSDSSILFIMVTTGIVGLILFINFIVRVPTNQYLIYSFGAILIHSLFANSLFYPHIMFWIFALVGLKTEADS